MTENQDKKNTHREKEGGGGERKGRKGTKQNKTHQKTQRKGVCGQQKQLRIGGYIPDASYEVRSL